MCCHTVMIHINKILHSNLFYKLTSAHENLQMVLILITCVLVSLSSWLFLWFLICGWVEVLFLSLLVNFLNF